MRTTIGDVTAIARPIDLRVPSNRFALLATVVVGLGAAIGTTTTRGPVGAGAAIHAGLTAGLGTLLAWAIAREIDPDRPRSARYAVFLFIPLLLAGPPGLAALFALLMALRLLARTTGLAPTGVDLVLLVGLAALAGISPPGLVTGLALAAALALDTQLPGGTRHDQRAAAAVAALGSIAVAVAGSTATGGWRGPDLTEVLVVALTVAAVPRLHLREVHSTSDLDGAPLLLQRVVAGRRLVVATIAGATTWAGFAAVPALAPAIAAVLGTALAAPAHHGRRPAGDHEPETSSGPVG